MSLIKDVRAEMRGLDCSAGRLRVFAVVLLLAAYGYSGYLFFAKGLSLTDFPAWLIFCDELLPLFVLFPYLAYPIYKAWMLPVFILGWFVSRGLMITIYFCIVSPLAVLARLAGKDFLDLAFKDRKTSYWKDKELLKSSNDYEKLY